MTINAAYVNTPEVDFNCIQINNNNIIITIKKKKQY